MRHVLGMAKSNIDLKGAKASKLELDYLRLAYTVKDFHEKGKVAIGYLLVMTDEIAVRASTWEEKYGAARFVEVLVSHLSEEDMAQKKAESIANASSQAAVTLGAGYSGGSTVEIGKRLGEGSLIKMIETREVGVKRCLDANCFPMGINWDYYGILQ